MRRKATEVQVGPSDSVLVLQRVTPYKVGTTDHSPRRRILHKIAQIESSDRTSRHVEGVYFARFTS